MDSVSGECMAQPSEEKGKSLSLYLGAAAEDKCIQGLAKRWALGCVNSPSQQKEVRRLDSRNLGPTF